VVPLKSKLRRKRLRDNNRDSRKRKRIENVERRHLKKRKEKPENNLRIRKKSRRPRKKQKPLRLLQTIERTKPQIMLRWQHLINLKLLVLLVQELVLVMQPLR
jgi:hypothetical protein